MSGDAVCEIDIAKVAQGPRLPRGSALMYWSRGHEFESYIDHFHSHELSRLV